MKKTEKITDAPEQADGDKKAILLKHFPQCFDKNGALDVARLQQALADEGTAFSRESYTLDWLGKSYARVLAGERPRALLAEDEAFNAQAENAGSGNMLIKGDNLEALKHLSHAYREKIKMIYIDPPYNTGSDGFVYHDNRRFTVQELSRLAGVEEEQAQRILDFTRSKSNSHSAWLTFMYPRLHVARRLLREDGVIFISIDDNEAAQLKILMDEIFGEENFACGLVHQKKSGGGQAKYYYKGHDHILAYARDIGTLDGISKSDGKKLKTVNIAGSEYWYDTDVIRRVHGKYNAADGHRNIPYEDLPEKSRADWDRKLEAKEYMLIFDEKIKKHYVAKYGPADRKSKLVYSILMSDSKYNLWTSAGADRLDELLKPNCFSNPKPADLIKLLGYNAGKNDIILDFFAGSGTTGDAVMQLNAEDGGRRKYILVQLDEPIDAKNNPTAYDFVKNELGAETPTIFDITKERLIRAARKIKAEHAGEAPDLGFKVFMTKPIWEDYEFIAEKREQGQELFDETQLTADDLKALLLTWRARDGMPFTQSVQPVDLGGYIACYEKNRLYLLDKGFTSDHLCELLRKADMDREFNPATVIAFGYHFKSAMLREMGDNIKNYVNRKNLEMKFITRY